MNKLTNNCNKKKQHTHTCIYIYITSANKKQENTANIYAANRIEKPRINLIKLEGLQ